MPYRYMMHVFCNECAQPHPAGIVIEREELLAPDQALETSTTAEKFLRKLS